MTKRPYFRVGFLLFLFSITSAQSLKAPENLPFQMLYRMNGPAYGDFLGSSVANAGDIDGDGKSDFIFGAHAAQGSGPITFRPGAAFVYSGSNGLLLYRKNGAANNDEFGASVAGIGDVNGDARDDFLVGAPEADPNGLVSAGSAYVYSGLNGSLIYQIDGKSPNMGFGISTAGVGDINSDGISDFVIGAYLADPDGIVNAGSAFVYSGADTSVLYQIKGDAIDEYLGISVDGTGDVNGDGIPDFIVGAYLGNPGGLGSTGLALVYSGSNGSLIYELHGDSANDYFGWSVSAAGDIDQNGKTDFIVGAPNANPLGLVDAGSAYVYSGATGSLLFRVNGATAGDCLGYSVTETGDVDGNGTPDFSVGAPCAYLGYSLAAGYARIYSGTDASLLFEVDGTPTQTEYSDRMGASVCGAGDINGDGKADIIVGDPLRNWLEINAGSAFVYSLVPTGSPEERQNRPRRFELSPNYPNPFNPTTTIHYYLLQREKVALEIFNLVGQRVKVLADGDQAAGEHNIIWDGKDEKGEILPSGIYFYKLTAKDFTETKKMIFLK